MFEIGDRVAYPMHGAGVVELIEEKEILGKLQSYYAVSYTHLEAKKWSLPRRTAWPRKRFGPRR